MMQGVANRGDPGQPAMNALIIELRHVSKTYGSHTVLKDIDLQIERGEFLTLLGPSGCGKTTILRILAGFEAPSGGTVLIDGVDVADLPPEGRQVNTVFQSYALFPHLSVFENVAFGPRLKGVNGHALRQQVLDALSMVKLEAFAERKPEQLSGGQQQRVAIARAVVNRPLVLLLDEPLSALDYKLRKAMHLELKQLQRRLGITFIFVTHDQEEALSMSDRVVVMNAGRIEQIGPPRAIYEAPKNLFVAQFVGEINILSGEVVAATPPRYDIRLHARTMSLKSNLSFAVADPVSILVRPEDLRIWREHEAGPEEASHLFPATVDEVIYKGSTVDMILRLDNGELLSTTQFFNEDDVAITELDFHAGERVYVDWVHDWEVILPHEDGQSV
jgi:spermidine/putrescine transport system ATP-binding protein